MKIVDMATLTKAITVLHRQYRIPHILITSINFPSLGSTPHLSVVGSTILPTALSISPSTDISAPISRIFKIDFPSLDCFFSGTGDMFAALMLVRLREAVSAVPGLVQTDSWISCEDVEATDLPLAKAAEKALASMQVVLERTKAHRDTELERASKVVGARDSADDEKSRHLTATKAAEVRLVRNLDCLRSSEVKFQAERLDF